MPNQINLGADVQDFPLGKFDDCDMEIASIGYLKGEFGTALQVTWVPALYEYAPRSIDEAERDNPEQNTMMFYSMGNGTYVVSPTGYEVEGPQPNKNTNMVKFILAMRAHGHTISGSDVSPFLGANLHWKLVESTYRRNGEDQVSIRMFPVGPALGYSKYADAGEVTENGIENAVSAPDRKEGINLDEFDFDPIKEVITTFVGESDSVVRRASISQHLKSADISGQFPTEIITLMARVGSLNKMIAEGLLLEEDGIYTLP